MVATGGVLYIAIVLWVIHQAKSTVLDSDHENAVFLVFGKQLIFDAPDTEYRARLDRLSTSRFHSAILMGGKTAGASISEALAGLDYLKKIMANPQYFVRLEQSSRNTMENLKNTRQLLNGQKAIIISNRYHLARCSVLASSLGIDHQLCPAEHVFTIDGYFLSQCLKEAFYLHWFFTGKSWAILTRNKRMLGKIS
jgi:uncharacterized SAM-binding protein YcdF (DUF218 family)